MARPHCSRGAWRLPHTTWDPDMKGKEKFINEVWFFFPFWALPTSDVQVWFTEKEKKKAKSGRLPSRYIKVAHWGQLSVTVALPGSAEVVRLEQEGEAGFTLHLAWHAFIKHPVSFLCFSYQESFSWILFLFLFFKSLRRLGGEVIRTGELGYGHKDWRALQDREIYVPKLPISHQPDMAAVCLTRALV